MVPNLHNEFSTLLWYESNIYSVETVLQMLTYPQASNMQFDPPQWCWQRGKLQLPVGPVNVKVNACYTDNHSAPTQLFHFHFQYSVQ